MNHEQSLADIFSAFMQKKAPDYGCRFHAFSLDGQDRDAGADYLLTDAARFAIVEFKYSKQDLVSEGFKPRRLTLCQKLLYRDDMRELHDRCHFICWTEGAAREVMTNIYRNEVCTQAVFGSNCQLPSLLPTASTRGLAGDFAREFFTPTGRRSLSRAQFESYVAWVLTETSASVRSTLELMAYDPTSNNLALVTLNSVEEAQAWVRTHVSPPPPRRRRKPGSGI
jgi:hypothetical protein